MPYLQPVFPLQHKLHKQHATSSRGLYATVPTEISLAGTWSKVQGQEESLSAGLLTVHSSNTCQHAAICLTYTFNSTHVHGWTYIAHTQAFQLHTLINNKQAACNTPTHLASPRCCTACTLCTYTLPRSRHHPKTLGVGSGPLCLNTIAAHPYVCAPAAAPTNSTPKHPTLPLRAPSSP
jgi:hypothetical protein